MYRSKYDVAKQFIFTFGVFYIFLVHLAIYNFIVVYCDIIYLNCIHCKLSFASTTFWNDHNNQSFYQNLCIAIIIIFFKRISCIYSSAFRLGHTAILSRAFKVGKMTIWSRLFKVGPVDICVSTEEYVFKLLV